MSTAGRPRVDGSTVAKRGEHADTTHRLAAEGATFTMKSGAKIADRSIVNVAMSVTLEADTQVSWDVQILVSYASNSLSIS